MSGRKGFVKIWRKVQDNEIWKQKPYDPWHAFETLILAAKWKKTQVLFQGEVIDLKRGQTATSYRQLAREWGWGRRRVQTFLKLLEKSGQIAPPTAPRAGHQFFVVTVSNYDTYQPKNAEARHERATDDTTTAPRPRHDRATTEEGKEGKETQEGGGGSASPSENGSGNGHPGVTALVEAYRKGGGPIAPDRVRHEFEAALVYLSYERLEAAVRKFPGRKPWEVVTEAKRIQPTPGAAPPPAPPAKAPALPPARRAELQRLQQQALAEKKPVEAARLARVLRGDEPDQPDG